MKKKILSLILATAMVATVFTACGDKTSEESISDVQTVVGSENKDEESFETTDSTEVVEVKESEDSSTSNNVPLFEQMSFDEYINNLKLADLSTFDIQLNSEAIESASEVDPETARNNWHRTQIAQAIKSGYESGYYSAYNPSNYSNTSDMVNSICQTYKDCLYSLLGTTELSFEETDVFMRDETNKGVTNEQIADAIDSFSNELNSSAVLVTIYDGYVTLYFDNGTAYHVNSITPELIYFAKSYCNGYETDDAPHVYSCDYNGNVVVTSE